jgi:hypothetical protein
MADIAEAMRKMTEAYAQGLAIMTRTLEGLSAQGPEARRLGEQWLRLARMTKDGAVTAMEQTFEIWEREVRRMLDAATPPEPAPPRNPMEAWTEAWTKGMRELASAAPGTRWAEEARRQTEQIQEAFQEGLRAWQRLWQAPERKP